jgi:predicted dehydrogenase
MNSSGSAKQFRVLVLSVVKHDYLPRAVAAHPRFDLVGVADDAAEPEWVHERNQLFADEFDIPYIRDVERALSECKADVAVVSSQAERHCHLSIRAVKAGLHVIQDKPMSTKLSECDRLVTAVERHRVKYLLWNRNFLPALLQGRETIENGSIGQLYAIHVDFYFAKDAGPPKGSRKTGDPPINWLERQIEAHQDGSDGGVGQEPMGELQVEGIYPLAYIQMLTGAPVRRVFARTAAHFHQSHVDNQVEDLATVSLEMNPGLSGSLCLGRIGAASHPDIGEIKIHVLGSEGALVLSEARPEVGIYYRGQPPQEFRHQRIANENDFLLAENFARAIDTDGKTALDAQDGRDICATVEAALASARSGQPVEVRSRAVSG